MQPTKPHNDVLAVVLTVGFLELIRTAWISDDAAITLRCVLNLLHGYGATFNIDERVQPTPTRCGSCSSRPFLF